MEKRSKKRIKTRHFASIAGIPGTIDDISEQGMRLSTSKLPKKKTIDISFDVYGEAIKVKGIIQWFIRKNTINSHHQLGVVVKNPPAEFAKLVKSSSKFSGST